MFFPNTFKVPQVSVLFNFQGPVPAALAGSSFILSHQVLFVKNFFEIFLSCQPIRLACCLCDSLFILLHPRSFVKTFFEVFLSLSTSASAKFPARFRASCYQEQVSERSVFRFASAFVSRDSLTIIPPIPPFVNTFFRFFSGFFSSFPSPSRYGVCTPLTATRYGNPGEIPAAGWERPRAGFAGTGHSAAVFSPCIPFPSIYIGSAGPKSPRRCPLQSRGFLL